MVLCVQLYNDDKNGIYLTCKHCALTRYITTNDVLFGGCLTEYEIERIFLRCELVIYSYDKNTTYTYSIDKLADLAHDCQVR